MRTLDQSTIDVISELVKANSSEPLKAVPQIQDVLASVSQTPVARRILFGREGGQENQTFFGNLECWGDGVVLFVPALEFADWLCFVSSSGITKGKDPSRTSIFASGHSIVTYGSNFDFAYFELRLDLWGVSTVVFAESGGETVYEILEGQALVLHRFFDTIFSPRSHG